jgi:phage repressor protein C with HTH and peptisase S24 domain
MAEPTKPTAQRLRDARFEAGFERASEAAEAFGWPYDGYKHHENGTRDYGAAAAARYARAFKVNPAWLLYGREPKRPNSLGGVAVIGKVGAHSEVLPIDEGAFEPIEPPFAVADGAVAFVVEGDSMEPSYPDGTYVIALPTDDLQSIINRRAVVTLNNGHRYLKKVFPGSAPGLYTLVSHNAPPIVNVRIIQAARVLGMVEP